MLGLKSQRQILEEDRATAPEGFTYQYWNAGGIHRFAECDECAALVKATEAERHRAWHAR